MGSVKWSWVACAFALSCGGDDGGPSGQGTGPGVMLDSSGDGINLDDDADGGEKLDVGSGAASMGGGDCSSGMGMPGGADYSLIWIANSPEGTVSKIDTKTGTELARLDRSHRGRRRSLAHVGQPRGRCRGDQPWRRHHEDRRQGHRLPRHQRQRHDRDLDRPGRRAGVGRGRVRDLAPSAAQ